MASFSSTEQQASFSDNRQHVCDSQDLSIRFTLRSAISLLLLAALSLLATVLLWRMCRGALVRPLPTLAMIGFGLALPPWTWLIRRLWQRTELHSRTDASSSNWRDYWIYASTYLVPSLLAVLIGACLTIRGAHPAGIALMWVALGCELLLVAAWPWLRKIWPNQDDSIESSVDESALPDIPTATAQLDGSHANQTTTSLVVMNEDDEEDADSYDEEQPWLWTEPGASQELRRLKTATGQELLLGGLSIEIAAGTRIATAHTVFHPPWPTIPKLMIDRSEPEAAQIKAVQLLPQGIRWEIKLPDVVNQSQVIRWSYVVEE